MRPPAQPAVTATVATASARPPAWMGKLTRGVVPASTGAGSEWPEVPETVFNGAHTMVNYCNAPAESISYTASDLLRK